MKQSLSSLHHVKTMIKATEKTWFYSFVCLIFEWPVPLAKLFLMWCMKILHSYENGSRKLEVNGPGHLPYYIEN